MTYKNQTKGLQIKIDGDRGKAGMYLGLAKSILRNMKMVVKSGMRHLSAEGGCVDIIVRTMLGHDSIYIKACSGGGCDVTVSIDNISGLEVRGNFKFINGEVGTSEYQGKFPGDVFLQAYYLIDWGDEQKSFFLGTVPETRTLNHTYKSSGIYTVNVQSWIKKELPNSVDSSTLVTKKSYFRHSDVNTGADPRTEAHANMLTKPWALVDASTLDIPPYTNGDETRVTYFWSGRRFVSERTVFEIDMSPLEDDEGNITSKLIALVSAFQGSAATYPDHQIGVYKNDVLLGELSFQDTNIISSSRLFELTELDDLTSVELKDTGDWAFLDTTGNPGFFVTNGDLHNITFYTYSCKAESNVQAEV